jgi:hypothetical protein
MDFVTSLPKTSEGFDQIMTVTDKFSKFVHFIPTRSTATSQEIAELFLTNIVAKKGLCVKLISDRDPKLTATHFQTTLKTLGCELAMTVSGRAQADGASERVIRVLRESMRPYIDRNHTNWINLLPWLALQYNTTVHSSTGFSPFMLEHGYKPILPSDVPVRVQQQESFSAQEHINNLAQLMSEAKDAMVHAFDSQATYYNAHRARVNINVGDYVLVKNQHLKDITEKGVPAQKLSGILAGPYKVIEKPQPNVVKLALPLHCKINNSFNVDQVKLYFESPDKFATRPRTEKLDEDGQPIYTVKAILNRRWSDSGKGKGPGVWEYELHYLDYPPNQSCWMPRNDLLATIPNMVEQFDLMHPFPEVTQAQSKKRGGKVGKGARGKNN